MKRRIILLGPPASGKGTQAQLIAEKFGLPVASTGALLREEQKRGTPLGREAEQWTAAGRLFPDEIALRVVRHWLDANGAASFVLDGFPRTLGQAEAFDAELSRLGSEIDLVVHFVLSDEEIHRRVEGRLTCGQCGASLSTSLHDVTHGDECPACGQVLVRRRDDNPDALTERLVQHHALTTPVVDYYRATGRLTDVDAATDRNALFLHLADIIEEGVPA